MSRCSSRLARVAVPVAIEPVVVIADDADGTRVVRPVAGAAGAVVVAHVRPQARAGVVGVAPAPARSAPAVLEANDLAAAGRADVVFVADTTDARVVGAPAREPDPPAVRGMPPRDLARKAQRVAAPHVS